MGPNQLDILTLAATILTGGREADLFAATEAGLVREVNTTHVRGSESSPAAEVPDLSTAVVTSEGTTTRVQAGVTLTLLHVLDAEAFAGAHELTLTGTWPGQEAPVLMATLDPAR